MAIRVPAIRVLNAVNLDARVVQSETDIGEHLKLRSLWIVGVSKLIHVEDNLNRLVKLHSYFIKINKSF